MASEAVRVGPGKLVAVEGIDGSGLSTQARLLHDYIADVEQRRVHLTKEPTDGPIGAQLRSALRGRLTLSSGAMALCFAADRLDHLDTEIEPRLQAGSHVISDRYVLSSLAYQSADLAVPWLRSINAQCRTADLTVFLDVPVEIAMRRLTGQRWRLELFETEERLRQVRLAYLELIPQLQDAGENIVVIPGHLAQRERLIDEVAADIRAQWRLVVNDH